MNTMSISQAANHIGCTYDAVYALYRDGRINGFEQNRQIHLYADEVIAHAKCMHQPPTPPANSTTQPAPSPNPQASQQLLTVKQAAHYLDCSISWINKLATKGKLDPIDTQEGRLFTASQLAHIAADYASRHTPKYQLPASGGYTLQDRIDPHASGCITPDIPLLSMSQVGAILGITSGSARNLVSRGILPACQKNPGAPGSKLFVPQWSVYALQRRPEYQRRRAIYQKGRANPAEYRQGWPDLDLDDVPFTGHTQYSANTDHGDYYSTRQVAAMLNIRMETVRGMRRCGRLTGYQRPIQQIRTPSGARENPVGTRWWFFRKEDVHALQNDLEYQRRSQQAKRALSYQVRAAKKAARQSTEFDRWVATNPPHPRPPQLTREDMKVDLGE